MSIDALLFDKDGTLFLFEATWESWARAVLLRLSDGDLSRAEVLGRAIGFDLPAQRFERDSVVIADSTGREEVVSCDTVILSAGIRSENALFIALKEVFPKDRVQLIGDAAAPRQAVEALEEAVRAVLHL